MSLPPLEELLARNGCLFAGAGAGKTHGLLTAALGLFAGAGGREPLAPGRLCLLTFTEKAAAEMRERLAARVELLAEDRGAEPELEAAFAALGRPLPPAAFWRRVQTALGAATLSTFHAYCARLLRQAPPGAGIPAGFELLAEEDAGELLLDTAEQRLLGLLDAGDADVEALCGQADLHGSGRGNGLLDLLVQAVVRLREEGRSASRLSVGDPEVAGETLARAVAGARTLVEETLPLVARQAPELVEPLQACLDVLHGLDAEAPPERQARLEALAGALPRAGRNGLRETLARVREALLEGTADAPGVLSAHAGCGAIRHEHTLRRLCDLVEADHRAALRAGGWMDFAELMVSARDLLRDDLGFRTTAQARIGALLVDEVQDTNGLQLELVVLLAEARDGGPRRVAREREAVLGLPLQPRFLLAVGDRKQSIYDFRGADVAVFEQLARKVEQEGGVRHFLRDNRRSQPALLEVLNAAARAALPAPAEPRDYEVVFRPEEDGLVPVRAQVGPEVCVDVLPVPVGPRGSLRTVEADILARWLRFLLSPEGPGTVVEGGVVRRARGGDVAILLRGFTGIDAYTEALREQHVRYRVLRDRNPYAAPSILDAAALLGLLADPGDALSLAAVLRSPLVGLSDAALFRLAEGGRLDPRSLDGPLPAGLAPDESERLLRFRALFATLSSPDNRLPLATLLDVAWTETGYRSALAAGPEADDTLAALDRLSALARQWDSAGRGDAGALARRLRVLAEQTSIGIATGVEQARAGNAVQLLTIHAAKGLQWPVVCLADLATTGVRAPNDRLLLDRALGLAWKPQGPFDAEPRRTPRWMEVRTERERRERAEAGRLLYVALTRAEDRLVLSGGGPAPDAWRNRLEPALAGPEVAPRLQRLTLEEIPPAPPPVVDAAEGAGDPAEGLALLARVRSALPLGWMGIALEASAVEDARRCPRRHWLLHQRGLLPGGGEVGDAPSGAGLPVRHRAARAQVLQALVGALGAGDWEAGVPDAALGPHLAVLGLSAGEGRALGLDKPLRALATTSALRAAVRAGTLAGRLDLSVEAGEARLEVRAPVAWADGGTANVLLVQPGRLPSAGLDAFAVTSSVVLHALAPLAAAARVGLAFVDGPVVEPHWVETPPLSVEELAREVGGLLHAESGLPGPRPRERCVALGCGFLSRCHPAPRGL